MMVPAFVPLVGSEAYAGAVAEACTAPALGLAGVQSYVGDVDWPPLVR